MSSIEKYRYHFLITLVRAKVCVILFSELLTIHIMRDLTYSWATFLSCLLIILPRLSCVCTTSFCWLCTDIYRKITGSSATWASRWLQEIFIDDRPSYQYLILCAVLTLLLPGYLLETYSTKTSLKDLFWILLGLKIYTRHKTKHSMKK